ncbi:hypothetical protein BV25DRAFT_1704461 [Artomyces pyxidatus]|uniref:Uncharacterized protein n=1 Tax=Artomyces pyxidatus TaxID=48021 RepID=A0ACB8TAH0_9AGAM|nr:hypothetical protein BV25DRAFT_1704461 [Artomyces pyxidatus]
MPTLREYAGCLIDPFDVDDGRKGSFLLRCQQVIDKLHPNTAPPLTTSSNIYNRARQRLSQWRVNFQKVANAVVKDVITARYGRSNNPKEDSRVTLKRNKDLIKAFVEETITGGSMFWRVPGTETSRADGSFRSFYILRVFACHLRDTEDSIFEWADGLPRGALLLSAVAVDRAFHAWKTGAFVELTAFQKENMEDELEEYLSSVLPLCEKSHRFDRVISMARKYITPGPDQSRKLSPVESSSSRGYQRGGVDASSPPPDSSEV